jgi:nicotinamide mononucleotide transporter
VIELLTLIEWTAVATGVLCVYLLTKENIWSWPFGLLSTTLLIIVFFHAKLYSDMLENFIYTFLQIYGWWFWLHGRKKKQNEKTVPIVQLSRTKWFFVGSIIAVGSAALGYGMATYTDADFAYLDAFTTVTSLVAQWLLNRKVLENWLLWITIDVLGIGIYWLKGLHSVALLYVLFLGLATKGYIDWRRSHNKQHTCKSMRTKVAA